MIILNMMRHVAPITKDKKPEKFNGVMGSSEHRSFILERTIKNCKWSVGDTVTYRRKPVTVTSIGTRPEECSWKGLHAKCVYVVDVGGEVSLVHPSELKRKRK